MKSGTPRCLIAPPFFFKDISDDAVFAHYARLIEGVGEKLELPGSYRDLVTRLKEKADTL